MLYHDYGWHSITCRSAGEDFSVVVVPVNVEFDDDELYRAVARQLDLIGFKTIFNTVERRLDIEDDSVMIPV